MVDFYHILKIGIVLVLFYFIKKMDIPDSYKFLLTVVPSLLLLSTNYVIRAIQFSGKNKPLMLKRKDMVSDKPIIDEYFFESFTTNHKNQNNFQVSGGGGADATLFEQEKPFWIQQSHNETSNYFDISNPHNFIAIDHLPPLGANYTLEFWLRLTYLSNNAIVSFYAGENRLFDITYDDKYLHFSSGGGGGTTKVPLPSPAQKWFHLVVMRGQADTIGTNRGLVYINGLLQSYLPKLPNLQDMTKAFLFKYSRATPPQRYNKKYHDLANAALVRFYSRSLTLDEIQNNFLKDAYTYDLQEENMTASRTYVQGTHLVLYIDARPAKATVASKADKDTHEVIFKNKKNNSYNKNSIVLKDIPLEQNWLNNFDFSSPNKTNGKKNKKNKKNKMLFQYTTTSITSKSANNNKTSKPIF